VKEHIMNDTEEAARRLLAVAAGDVPAGIDLLRGVRARQRSRARRTRAAISAGTIGVLAATGAITASVLQAPTALAQVTQAAARTAAQSYRVTSTVTAIRTPEPGGTLPPVVIRGAFDPARRIGEVSGGVIDVRYLGRYLYLRMPPAYRRVYQTLHHTAIPAGKTWVRFIAPAPSTGAPGFGIYMLGNGGQALSQSDPQDLLALLKAASDVREIGPVSGPGWTGEKYAFAATRRMGDNPLHLVLTIHGTVDVDQHGRVRLLAAVESIRAHSQAHRTTGSAVKIVLTFGDFGTHVSVNSPPPSKTFIPAAAELGS
jgi:hypothetical protein